MKRISLIFLLLCAFVFVTKAQNTLLIHLADGNTNVYSFNELNKITFADDNMFLHVATPVSVPINSVRKMTFSNISFVESLKTNKRISLFPNPAHSFISIMGDVNIHNMYELYDMQGKLLMHGQLNQEKTISVDMLQKGLYILRIENTNLKFCKL